jgi:hypothetical protein
VGEAKESKILLASKGIIIVLYNKLQISFTPASHWTKVHHVEVTKLDCLLATDLSVDITFVHQ